MKKFVWLCALTGLFEALTREYQLYLSFKAHHKTFQMKYKHNLHIEREQAGPVQFKMFLLKYSNDTDFFNCLSVYFTVP